MRQRRRYCDAIRPDAHKQLADIPHPSGARGVLPEADFLPLSVLINAAAGNGDVHVGMPVESPSVGMNGAENADIQRPSFAGGVQQVIDGQAAEVVEQPAVDLKQRPQRIRKGEDEVYPVAVRQAVKLGGNPEVGGLFPAGRAGPAVAGVGDVFYVVAAGVIAAVFLHTADAGATGEHFCDSFNFDITEAASVKEGGPALVGSEQFFEWSGAEVRKHSAD